jgi:hypothetical protein
MADGGSSGEPVCEPGDLAVTVRWDPDGNGGLRGQVIAENVSGRACRLPGKPTVTPVGLDGTPLPVQTVVTMEWVQPGYVTLQPGQRAAAPAFWLSWCGQRASDRARVSWGDHFAMADVHGPHQPECTAGKTDNLSSSWFRLTDLPGGRGCSESDGLREAAAPCRAGVRFRVQDEQPVDGARLPVFGLGAGAFQRQRVLFDAAQRGGQVGHHLLRPDDRRRRLRRAPHSCSRSKAASR